jgi:hypothetical protein
MAETGWKYNRKYVPSSHYDRKKFNTLKGGCVAVVTESILLRIPLVGTNVKKKRSVNT